MRDDNDFASHVLTRCVLEAAGRVLWVLDGTLDVRARVGRSVALRVRGLRDVAKQAADVSEAYPDDAAIAAEARRFEAPIAKALKRAFDLKIPVHLEGGTVVGLRESTPSNSTFAFEPLRQLNDAGVVSFYSVWSAAVHSTYAAISSNLVRDDAAPARNNLRLSTSLNDRLRAASLAVFGSVQVYDALVEYFGFEAVPERAAVFSTFRHVSSLWPEEPPTFVPIVGSDS
jgi:hypothetical protein